MLWVGGAGFSGYKVHHGVAIGFTQDSKARTSFEFVGGDRGFIWAY